MTPPNERKAAERQRKKAAGLVRCEVWVKPEHVAQIRDLADELNNPPTISPETLASIRRNASKCADAQSRAAEAQLAEIGRPVSGLERTAYQAGYSMHLTNP